MYTIKFENEESIPAELKDFVKDNAVTVVPQSKAEALRTSNVALAKQLEDASSVKNTLAPLLEQYEDPAEILNDFKAFQDMKQQVEDGKLKATDSITAEVEKRTVQMQERYKADIAEREDKLKNVQQILAAKEAAIRDNVLVSAVRELLSDQDLGLNPAAERAIIAEARDTFKVKEDSSITAQDAQGNTIWGPTGDKALTPKQWAETTLRERAPYVYVQSNGAGSNGDGGNPGNDAFTQDQARTMDLDSLFDESVYK